MSKSLERKHGEPELLADIWARCLECYEEGGPRRCEEGECLLRGKEGQQMNEVFIDGDFPTGAECKYHCSPTCHPGQVDENEWHYGCLHKAWPQNRAGDFCPFVKCGGVLEKCEIPGRREGKMLNPPRTVKEAIARKYGKHDYELGWCAWEIDGMDKEKWNSSPQCLRKPGHGPGFLYCKQHAKKVEVESCREKQ